MMKTIWKIRAEKPYAGATNHVIVGELVEETDRYVRMRCRTFHFGKPVATAQVHVGGIKTRLFPWHTIAYVTVLAPDFPWKEAAPELTESGDIVFRATGEVLSARRGGDWLSD